MSVILLIVASFFCQQVATIELWPAWGYQCEKSACIKVALTESNIESAISLPVCRLFCGDDIGTLWPKPTGSVKIVDGKIARIDISQVVFDHDRLRKEVKEYMVESEKRFRQQLGSKVPSKVSLKNGGLKVLISTTLQSEDLSLTYDTDESYTLTLQNSESALRADIHASTYYGARHALETLLQLIVYDDIRNELQAVAEVEIKDSPAYKHRGVILDTSRSFFSLESILRTIDTLAMVKMNTFHWHITDSHSFPIILKSLPDLSKYGAYSPRQVYTEDDIKRAVQYGRVRGVRVIPEFDAPAHVGEGWQNTGLVACFNSQPWNKFCVEPPCGQLDPTKDELYETLEKIYADFVDYFQPLDTIFHMGGDEVSVACWNSSNEIQNWMKEQGWSLETSDFMKLWGRFQEKALDKFDKVAKRKIPIVLWTSGLTEQPYIDEYLNNERYIIQIWTKGNDEVIQRLLQKGYKLILSNYDALYLDCGFAGWVTGGNNWCSPYIGWQKVYDNDPKLIASTYESQILGSEAALWSEQADELTLDARLWPRVSALAERLWTSPSTSWRDAESRMLVHRERLVEHGIAAELIQPQWCLQNENQCPIE